MRLGYRLTVPVRSPGQRPAAEQTQPGGDLAVLKALGASTTGLLRNALGQAAVLLAAGALTGTGLAAVGALLAGSAVPLLLSPATSNSRS